MLKIFGTAALLCIVLSCRLAAQTLAGDVGTYKKLSLAQLMDLEVTSVSLRPEKISDSPSSVQMLTGEDLQRTGATRIPEALRQFSNLQVAQVDGRQWAITARGFNNTIANKLLVLIDGRSIYTPLFAGVFWDAQATFMPDLDRIEVISGPGATQWGSNAVNGVINIISKPAKDTHGGLLFGGVGTEMPADFGARYGGAIGPNLHYRLYGQNSQRGGARLMNGSDAGDDWRQSQGGIRLDWDAFGSDLVTFQGDRYTGSISQLNTGPIRISGGNALVRLYHELAPHSNFTLQSYYDRAYRRVPNSFAEDQETFDTNFQHRFPAGPSHNVVWGLAARSVADRFTSGPIVLFLPAVVRREWYSGFFQDEITLPNEKWHLTAGAKLERNPYTGFEIQPSLRLASRIDSKTLLWGAISRAVRTPSRTDRELFSPAAPPHAIAGGPNFGSEKLLAFEVGARSQPSAKLSMALSLFFNEYGDLRSVEPVAPGSATSVLANGLKGKSYGAEWHGDYRLNADVRLRFGLTEMRTQSRPKAGSADRTSTKTTTQDSNHQLLISPQIDLPAHLYFNATLRYFSPIGNQAVPGYSELDARLSWQPTEKWELTLSGRNLLHARHAEFGPMATRREIERSLRAVATWRF